MRNMGRRGTHQRQRKYTQRAFLQSVMSDSESCQIHSYVKSLELGLCSRLRRLIWRYVCQISWCRSANLVRMMCHSAPSVGELSGISFAGANGRTSNMLVQQFKDISYLLFGSSSSLAHSSYSATSSGANIEAFASHATTVQLSDPDSDPTLVNIQGEFEHIESRWCETDALSCSMHYRFVRRARPVLPTA